MTATACLRLASSFKHFSSLRACERGRKKGMNVERKENVCKKRSEKEQHNTRSIDHTPLPTGKENLCLLLVKKDGHC